VNDRYGVKQTNATGAIDPAAGICDLGSVELFGRRILEPAKDANDAVVQIYFLREPAPSCPRAC